MDSKLYQKAFFTLIFLTIILVSFLIIKPFLTAVLTAMLFSYVFYPLYLRIRKKIKYKNPSALIASILVILIITLPLFFILNTISKDAYSTYLLTRQKMTSVQLLDPKCQGVDSSSCKIINYLQEKADNPQFRYYFDTSIKSFTTKITDSISNVLFTIPKFVMHLFITLFVTFFLFRDGKLLIKKIEKLMPLRKEHRTRVFEKLNGMAYAVIYGSLVIAVIQGTLGGIGFFIFGLPTPFLWGLVMIVASFIPYIGSSIVWFPAALFLLFNGYLDLDSTLMVKGILLILYGIFVVGTVDNILKPKIIGDKGGLHPVLVLLGVIGGLQFLGVIGLFIGPIILALLVAFVNIYEEEKE